MVEQEIWKTSNKDHVSPSFLMLRFILDYSLTIYVGFISDFVYHAQCASSYDVADSVAAVRFPKLKW